MTADSEDSSREPERDAGWERLGVIDWKLAIAVSAPITVVMAVVLPIQLTGSFTRDLPIPLRVLATLVVSVVLATVVVAIMRLRTPQVYVDVSQRLIRTRRETIRWDELDRAELLVAETKHTRALILLLRSGKSFRVPIVVRRAKEKPVLERTRTLAGEVIRGSSIAMPVSKDDPTGRFARFNFPTNVTKEEALELVENPPSFGEPIPIPAQR